ncbi:MAG TPA: asparagine synthase-related protein [Pyrinomonadaceae bacterium]|nr:asparagine synthase-related protein [Pyrinomonadaceae bacterium]
MSGIVGIVNLDGAPVDRDLLSRMTTDVWIDGNVGFGGTATWITADARIDGWTDTDLTDVERIVRAYETWGDECVEHLIGDFAFAIWDKRHKRLFCARDHFGVKPFFYSRVGNSFIFSSTLNVLRRDARVSDELNETAVNDYLEHGLNQDLSTTIFRDIQRLPGGHTLTIANGSLSTRRYWTPGIKNEIRFRDPRSYVERFNELLTAATKDRLRTNRVSISMSGGLDSTSLAVIARDLLQETSGPAAVQAVTVVYDDLIPDHERHYSTVAASSLGIPIHHVRGDDYALFEERRAGDLDQPEPFLISPFAGQFNDSLRLMAGHSNVALTGYDGDALMNEPQRSFLRSLLRSFKTGENPRHRHATFRALRSKVWAPLFEGYDRGSTRLQLEVRHPFIDVRLVDYVLSIPVNPWCTNKQILRRAMKDRLPAAIVNRPKTPLAGDLALQLMRRGSVRWRDSFEVTPQLERFVNLSHRRSLAEANTPDAVWARLRLFAFNHWLAHSLPRDRRMVA